MEELVEGSALGDYSNTRSDTDVAPSGFLDEDLKHRVNLFGNYRLDFGRSGSLVLGGIHMSDIPSLPYRDLYWERLIRSVANNTREDGRAFLAEAAEVGVRTHVQTFGLDEANDALIALKHDAVRGAAVLVVEE